MTKLTNNQQIYVDWCIPMTDSTDFVTFVKTNKIDVHFYVDLYSTLTKPTKF